jgi:hypothetical protein
MPYAVDPVGVKGLRPAVLRLAFKNVTSGGKSTSYEKVCKVSSQAPIVYMVHRNQKVKGRRVMNPEEVFNATKEMCPSCHVEMIDFQNWDKMGQVRVSCNVSVLIGIHGSGLIHANWMPRSSESNPTGIIEFLPYLYTCRDWYEVMAKTAGVEYYGVKTLRLNQSVWRGDSLSQECHKGQGNCLDGRCHDFLRDQSITVDVNYYKSETRGFFKRLEKSVKKAEGSVKKVESSGKEIKKDSVKKAESVKGSVKEVEMSRKEGKKLSKKIGTSVKKDENSLKNREKTETSVETPVRKIRTSLKKKKNSVAKIEKSSKEIETALIEVVNPVKKGANRVNKAKSSVKNESSGKKKEKSGKMTENAGKKKSESERVQKKKTKS